MDRFGGGEDAGETVADAVDQDGDVPTSIEFERFLISKTVLPVRMTRRKMEIR